MLEMAENTYNKINMEKKQMEESIFNKSICSICGNNGRLGRCLVDNNKVPRGIVECKYFMTDELNY